METPKIEIIVVTRAELAKAFYLWGKDEVKTPSNYDEKILKKWRKLPKKMAEKQADWLVKFLPKSSIQKIAKK